MKDTLRLLVATAVVVASVSMVAVAPAAAQSGGLEVSAEGGEVDAGENVTVSFSVENTGEATGVVLNITEAPDGWSVVSQENANGTWNSNENKWIWLTVDADETVEPSVTMSVPDDASGEYTVGATASTSDSSTDVEATVTVAGSGTETSTSGGSGPGFGVAVTLVALLAVALLARRQG
jgi:PGF-CTERM protein